MIIGEQPAHFRYVWNQTQYYGDGSTGYISRSGVNQGMTSFLTSDLGDGWEEVNKSLHYFQLYAVAGPGVPHGLYRWDTNETMTQLVQRKGWTVIAGPRPAHFSFYSSSYSNWYNRLNNLRCVVDPARDGWHDEKVLIADAAYTGSAGDEIMLVLVINSVDEIQAYRPLMVLPFAPARTLNAGTELHLDNVQLDNYKMYYDDADMWRDMYYRGIK